MKKALITGITGQDGSYLAELLLEKGYEVHGLRRRISIFNTQRIDHIISNIDYMDRFKLYYSDLNDSLSIFRLINDIKPDEIYNLAAMSHVHISFDVPEYVADIDGLGTLRILEAVRAAGLIEQTKIYQASTSELFGKVVEVPQTEKTPFYPRSPYGVAKIYGFWITKNYRESYNMFAANGILFNHESPRRGETFVSRKITIGISNIISKKQTYLELGNLNARRDWGHAKDYVDGMFKIMQQPEPDDFVLATGRMHSVREFLLEAFNVIGIKLGFKGSGLNEYGFVIENLSNFTHLKRGDIVVKVNPKYFRKTEVEQLLGDPSKAKEKLNWEAKISFEDLVKEMVLSDLKLQNNSII